MTEVDKSTGTRVLRRRLACTLCLLLPCVPGALLAQRATSARPNVVFILADDLGWTQTGVYGSRYYLTPNIDRLAAEGLRFTDAYSAAPVCSPGRAGLMTGKYPARLHLTDYIPGYPCAGCPLKIPDWQKFLPLEEYTLGELFRDAGYHTALFGKWHLSIEKPPPGSLPYNPDKQGFDEAMITYKPRTRTDPEHDPHNSDSIANRAVEFLKTRSDKPFFMFLSFNAIHDPLKEKADSIAWWANQEGSGRPENTPVLAAMLKRLDSAIGRVLTALDTQGLRRNTMVIFFSDNGGFEKDADQAPLRRGKGWLYEGGIRVPLIVRWPGVLAPGDISHEPVIGVDFLPTFCELLGRPVPRLVDGRSMLRHWKTGAPLPERNIYWHYPHYMSVLETVPQGAVRSGRWKLIEWYEPALLADGRPRYELYDLERDYTESRDLADLHPGITRRLGRQLSRWRKQVDAQMPVPVPEAGSAQE